MTPYQAVSASEHIYQGVRHMMLRGELRPGQRVVQRALAEKFGTSNIPVIEAIRRLEQDGLLVSRPNVGACVPEWTRADIVGSYLTREALEGVAARLWTEHATAEDAALLKELDAEFRTGVGAGDPALYSEADMALHMALVSGAGVRPLERAYQGSATLLVTMSQNGSPPRGQTRHPSPDAHRDLLAALLARDGAAAEDAARSHVRNALQLWLER